MNARTKGPLRSRERAAIELDDAYLRAIEKLESLPQNQGGADKSWVERSLRSWRDVCRRAVRVR